MKWCRLAISVLPCWKSLRTGWPRSKSQSNRMMKISHGCFLVAALCCMACNSDYTPQPRGYFKIEFPEKAYQKFDRPGFPYTFEYPVYAQIIQDTLFFEARPENPYWINVD